MLLNHREIWEHRKGYKASEALVNMLNNFILAERSGVIEMFKSCRGDYKILPLPS